MTLPRAQKNIRREARERALQLLFQLEVNPPGEDSLAKTFERFWKQQVQLDRERSVDPTNASEVTDTVAMSVPERLQTFTERLVRGVRSNIVAIDRRLSDSLQNWDLKRLGGVERNVLRLAVYELFHEEDVPPVVCINEAVDLAKFFSATESGRFVNGVLDRIRCDVKRDPRSTKPRQNRGCAGEKG